MYTKADLIGYLEAMGLKRTDALLVHSSMKAIGPVEGGADTVVDAFMEYLKDGLLITPTHTWDRIGKNKRTLFDPQVEGNCVGIIPTLFSKREGVLRSLHPTHSVAAWGPDAADYIRGEEKMTSPCTPGGCWDRLREVDARILLLGVTHNRNTFLHAVDEALEIPDRLTQDQVPLQIRMPDGSICETRMHRHFNSTYGSGAFAEYYEKLADAFYGLGAAKKVKFGDADCILCEARKLFEVCKKLYAIEENCIIHRETIPESWWK